MPKPSLTPEEFALRINSLRSEIVQKCSFSQEEITSFLREKNIPCSVAYFGVYVKYGIIVRIGRGEYQFTEEPVYKGVIEQALTSIRKYKVENAKKLSGKQEQEELAKRIESSINFLKANGYLVFKPM